MSEPKYKRLGDSLSARIYSGELAPRQKLPTEAELMVEYGCSRQTVRQALARLVDEGLITKTQGSGSHVTDRARFSRRTMRIAVLTTYISEYIFPSILRGISAAASERSYSVLLNATDNSIAKERAALAMLLGDPVDGIIAEGTKTALPNPNALYYRQLAELGIPIVFFNGYYPELDCPGIIHVVTDDFGGGYQAVRRLAAAGHTSIGGIFKSDDIQGVRRFSGFIQATVDNSLTLDDNNILWFTTENKEAIFNPASLSHILKSCTALVCYNDQIAANVLPLIASSGSTVRSIVSFDRNFTLPGTDIDFYSLGHPRERLGRLAAQKLFNMIEGNSESSVTLQWV